MTAPLPADARVPVDKLWSKVAPKDVVLDPHGQPWMVEHVDSLRSGYVAVTVTNGPDTFTRPRNPDETVPVLVHLVKRQAVETLRDAFGAVRVTGPDRDEVA